MHDDRFSNGTRSILKFIKNDKKRKYVLGGGETLESINLFEPSIFKQKNVFVSTGGGAML
jgi:3-phosphoglycerate kinase